MHILMRPIPLLPLTYRRIPISIPLRHRRALPIYLMHLVRLRLLPRRRRILLNMRWLLLLRRRLPAMKAKEPYHERNDS
jgi:hypothetical protein